MTAPMAAQPAPPAGPMALLASGVPLSLLMDVVWGPPSADVLQAERTWGGELPDSRPA